MGRRYRRWEQRVFALARRMDSLLIRLVVVAALALLVTQIALRSSLFLAALSRVDHLEGAGQPNLSQLAAWERFLVEKTVSSPASTLSVTLELLQPKPTARVKLLVNGEIRGNFAQTRLTFTVADGDLVEVDTMEERDSVTVRVSGTSSGLEQPMVGQYVQAMREIRPLGRVQTKSSR